MQHFNSAEKLNSNGSEPSRPQEHGLHILLVVHRRVDEVLITGIVKQTTHRLHIVDAPDMIEQSLDLQTFDLALVCDNDLVCAKETLTLLRQHPNGQTLPIIGICCQQREENQPELFDSKISCLLHSPITSHKLTSLLNHYAEKLYGESKK